jgi:hypothetical protein
MASGATTQGETIPQRYLFDRVLEEPRPAHGATQSGLYLRFARSGNLRESEACTAPQRQTSSRLSVMRLGMSDVPRDSGSARRWTLAA